MLSKKREPETRLPISWNEVILEGEPHTQANLARLLPDVGRAIVGALDEMRAHSGKSPLEVISVKSCLVESSSALPGGCCPDTDSIWYHRRIVSAPILVGRNLETGPKIGERGSRASFPQLAANLLPDPPSGAQARRIERGRLGYNDRARNCFHDPSVR